MNKTDAQRLMPKQTKELGEKGASLARLGNRRDAHHFHESASEHRRQFLRPGFSRLFGSYEQLASG